MRITVPADTAAVSITDLSGRTVRHIAATAPVLDTDLSALPAGHYLVTASGHAARLIKR